MSTAPMMSDSEAAAAIRSTPVLLAEARGWVTDAFDLEPGDTALDDVVPVIARYYDGGLTEFIRNSTPLLTPTR